MERLIQNSSISPCIRRRKSIDFSVIQLPKVEKVKVGKAALNLNIWPRKIKIEVIITIVESSSQVGKCQNKRQIPTKRCRTVCVLFQETLTTITVHSFGNIVSKSPTEKHQDTGL